MLNINNFPDIQSKLIEVDLTVTRIILPAMKWKYKDETLPKDPSLLADIRNYYNSVEFSTILMESDAIIFNCISNYIKKLCESRKCTQPK